MAQDTTPAIIVYRGNGDNSVPYDVPFDKGYYGDIKVLFVRRGLADYTYNPTTYTVNGRLYAWFSGAGYVYTHTPNPAVGAEIYNNFDEDTGNTVSAISGQTITDGVTTYTRAVQHDIANQLELKWTGTVLTSDDFICIVRDTERGQPYTFPNNQKHIEGALDNIERQVQENKNKLDNALLVDPSYTTDASKMNPLDWMKSIIRCMDFSVRALRYANGWLDYSLDDPNVADADKTWNHLLNTDNIKEVRERRETIDNTEHYWVEYLTNDGLWRKLTDGDWESRIEHAEEVAQEAKDIAQDAIDLANSFDGRITKNEEDIAEIIAGGNIDDVTIQSNASNKWEVQAVINRNTANGATNPIYDWVGTQAEYIDQDVAAQHPDWLCYITDDMFNPGDTYAFEQGESASTWYITHNLNKYPSVTVVDSAGTTVDCTVIYINSNECELRFNSAFKGTAYLN